MQLPKNGFHRRGCCPRRRSMEGAAAAAPQGHAHQDRGERKEGRKNGEGKKRLHAVESRAERDDARWRREKRRLAGRQLAAFQPCRSRRRRAEHAGTRRAATGGNGKESVVERGEEEESSFCLALFFIESPPLFFFWMERRETERRWKSHSCSLPLMAASHSSFPLFLCADGRGVVSCVRPSEDEKERTRVARPAFDKRGRRERRSRAASFRAPFTISSRLSRTRRFPRPRPPRPLLLTFPLSLFFSFPVPPPKKKKPKN